MNTSNLGLPMVGRPLDIKGQWIKRHLRNTQRETFPVEAAGARFTDASRASYINFWFTSDAATYRLPDVAHKELEVQ